MSGIFNDEIITKMSPEGMAAALSQVSADVKIGFEALARAYSLMAETFGEYADILPNGQPIAGYTLKHGKLSDLLTECGKEMNKTAWAYLFNKSGVREIMSISQVNKVNDDLKKPLPEFTPDNVRAWLDDIKGQLPNMMIQSVKEVFEFLRPRHNRHKTNTEYEIGEKVILSGMVSHGYGGAQLSYYGERTAQITALSNVFLMLDGKQPATYPNDTLTGLKSAMQDKKPEYKDAYFRMKWFPGAGTLHVWFLRLDLVDALNQCAAGKVLKHNNDAKKPRQNPVSPAPDLAGNDADLLSKFVNCAPEFREKVRAHAATHGQTIVEVYRAWREYSKWCSDVDQSAVWGEFEEIEKRKRESGKAVAA